MSLVKNRYRPNRIRTVTVKIPIQTFLTQTLTLITFKIKSCREIWRRPEFSSPLMCFKTTGGIVCALYVSINCHTSKPCGNVYIYACLCVCTYVPMYVEFFGKHKQFFLLT